MTFIEEFSSENQEKESETVITVDGPSGAGKGTMAKQIANILGLKHFSASDVFYSIAEERGITHIELSKQAEKEVDLEVDRKTLKRGLKNNCVIDGRIPSWVMGKNSDLKIYLTANDKTRYQRIAQRENITFEEAKEKTEKRDAENKKRYKNYYDLDIGNLEIYDLVIDNTEMNIREQEKTLRELLKIKQVHKNNK